MSLVKERLYVEGLVNKLFEDISNYGEGEVEPKTLMESILREEKGKSIISDIVDEFKLAPKFIFSFGTGIGAFYEPIDNMLKGSGVNLSEYQIYLLIITSIGLLLNETSVKKMYEKLEEEGIRGLLDNVTEYIKNTKTLVNSVVKKVLGVSYSLSDILAFTTLLVPTMNILSSIINEYGITSTNVSSMLKGVVLAASVYGIKSVLKRIKNKIS
jgi:hypothetical protein